MSFPVLRNKAALVLPPPQRAAEKPLPLGGFFIHLRTMAVLPLRRREGAALPTPPGRVPLLRGLLRPGPGEGCRAAPARALEKGGKKGRRGEKKGGRLKEQVRIYKCTNDPSVLQGRFTFPLDFPQSIQFLFTSDTRHHSEFGRNLHCSFMCCTCHSTLSTDLCNTVLQASTPSSWGI